MKLFNLEILLILILAISCAKTPELDNIKTSSVILNYSLSDYYPTSNGEVVHHSYYSLSYLEEHEQAEWVFYMLTPEMVNGEEDRTNDFREDPLVSTGSAALSDYVGSGYDRGHLAPAKAMSLNKTSMSESFFMSNMSPQSISCNRGKWKSLETKVREWVNNKDTLYIASGAILKDSIGSIGANKVTIPSSYYKVIYDPYPNPRMIAFIMPNRKMDESIDYYVVSVDKVEMLTNIDFYSILPDKIENSLEIESDYSLW